jgi:hypothetical protein
MNRRWRSKVAGLPCLVESLDEGDWVVTLASTTTSRGRDLKATILAAGGGVVGPAEAEALTALIVERMGERGS